MTSLPTTRRASSPHFIVCLLATIPLVMALTPASAQFTIDGELGVDPYGSAHAIQLAPSTFGDNTDADVLSANGSELNVAYAVIRDGHLHLFFAGNLETNFNKLDIFIDSIAGGQNTLGSSNPNVDFDGLNAMAGLKFDTDFEADFYLTAGGGNSPDEEFFFSFAEVQTAGTGSYIGQTAVNVQTATLSNAIEVGINNSNIGGVTASDATVPSAADAANVTTGIEFKIPLSVIGNATGPVKICAFINNTDHTFISNQVLGSLPAIYGNLASPATVDFTNDSGDQFFTVLPWVVTNNNATGAGSLRQTIADATSGATITFDPSLDGLTITLSSGGQLIIDQDLNIDASSLSSGITIDANQLSRVMQINAGKTATLSNLTISNGDASGGDNGGGIFNNGGTVTLNNATLHSNSADTSGGGIYNSGGTLTVNNTTLSNNSASYGGGISSDESGTVTLNNTTLYNNSALDGGAIDNFAGTLTLNNATLYSNSATGTGGGIYNNSTLTLNNSIVAQNSASSGADIFHIDIISSTGVNIIGDNNTVTSLFPAGPLVGTTGFEVDPLLSPFGFYGGPTMTLPPITGSPAIDAGNNSTVPVGNTTDQRGESRIVNVIVDIGAVEIQDATNIKNNLIAQWATDTDGDGSLFGIEFALGTDPFNADIGHVNNLTTPTFSGGEATLNFGLNPSATAYTIWILKRSTDLVTFTEIYRYDGPTTTETLQSDIASVVTATSFSITDENPPAGKAFYILEALVAP